MMIESLPSEDPGVVRWRITERWAVPPGWATLITWPGHE